MGVKAITSAVLRWLHGHRFGPPATRHEVAETAIDSPRRGYSACGSTSGLVSGWIPLAERPAARTGARRRTPSTHLFGFMGHLRASGRKFASAIGALDRSRHAGTSGAELVVFHPGFLLDRP
jgi:hypothetical protein